MNYFFSVLVMFFCAPAWSYFSAMDTGEVIEKGKYSANLGTQFVTTNDTGANLVGRFDTGINQELSLRAIVGAGVVDLFGGVLLKWVPIPDYENQPAIGLLMGPIYARDSDVSILTLRVHPIVSKKFNFTTSTLIPFASLGTGVRFTKNTSDLPLQISLGSHFMLHSLPAMSFMAEWGLGVANAFSYINVAIVLPFDTLSSK